MQAFGTPWGPLVAPEVPQGTDVTAPFLTGAQMAMANNSRMRALERQNLLYQLAEERMQNQHENQMNRLQFARESEADRNQRSIDRLEAQKERYGDLYYLADEDRRRKENNFDTRIQIQQNASKALSDAQAAINNLNVSDDPATRPGGSRFPYEASSIVARYAPALPDKDQLALRNQIASIHNAAHTRDVSTYKMMKDTLDADVGNTLGYDANLRPDYSGVFNPKSLTPETSGGLPYLGWGAKPTGNYQVKIKTSSGDTPTRIVTPQQLTDFNNRWQQVQKKYNDLTSSRFINDPQAGVTGTGDPSADQVQQYKAAAAVYSSTDPNTPQAAKDAAARFLFGGAQPSPTP